jgi:hypothetical protein
MNFILSHRRRIQSDEGFGSGTDELSVGVDGSFRDVFDDVGFEQNGFPADVQIEEPKPVVDELIEFVRVLVCVKDCDA